MGTDKEKPTIIIKEMGITHKDFYAELPNLLNDIPYQQSKETVKFQLNGKNIEIILGPEGCRQLGRSVRLPVTFITLCFFDFSEDEINCFIKHFNIRFMKGGG